MNSLIDELTAISNVVENPRRKRGGEIRTRVFRDGSWTSRVLSYIKDKKSVCEHDVIRELGGNHCVVSSALNYLTKSGRISKRVHPNKQTKYKKVPMIYEFVKD